MVRLDRIYTRGGDKGMTSLGDGTRVRKTHARIAAYGTVDELNAVLGLALLQRGLGAPERALLQRIQNDLFDVGADLCVPRAQTEPEGERLRVTPGQVRALEVAIDARNARLQALTSFVLPGGRPAAAWLHLARVVCRRSELQVARLFEDEPKTMNPQAFVYLNRLSDLLFVMARMANDAGRGEALWRPGAASATDAAGGAARGAGKKRARRAASATRKAAGATGSSAGKSRGPGSDSTGRRRTGRGQRI